MRPTDSEYQIMQLTDAFYDNYPNPPHIEILKKGQRAYGTTIWQYASFLKEMGARSVFGIVCVKSLKDSDNT